MPDRFAGRRQGLQEVLRRQSLRGNRKTLRRAELPLLDSRRIFRYVSPGCLQNDAIPPNHQNLPCSVFDACHLTAVFGDFAFVVEVTFPVVENSAANRVDCIGYLFWRFSQMKKIYAGKYRSGKIFGLDLPAQKAFDTAIEQKIDMKVTVFFVF